MTTKNPQTTERTTTTRNAAKALDLLIRLTGIRELDFQRLTGVTAVSTKKRGLAPITLDDIDAFTKLFQVPASVFFMTETELFRWMADTQWVSPDFNITEISERTRAHRPRPGAGEPQPKSRKTKPDQQERVSWWMSEQAA